MAFPPGVGPSGLSSEGNVASYAGTAKPFLVTPAEPVVY